MIDLDAFEGPLDDAAREAGISREEALERAIVALAEANDVDVPTSDEIAAIDERIEGVDERLRALDEEVASHEEVERIRAVVSSLGETTERLESTVASTTTDLERLRAEIDSLDGDVDEAREGVDALRSDLDEVANGLASLGAEIDGMADGIDSLQATLEGKIEDLRDRVVRIYRDVERKAPEDHAHPDIESTVDELAGTVDGLGDALDAVEARLDGIDEGSTSVDDRVSRLESRVAEEIDRDDDVDEKLSRVASAVVGVQRRLAAVELRTAGRERLATLTAAANRHGVRKADCEHCHETVHLGLLMRPECPHCDRAFGDLVPKTGFFGTSTLTVGDPPALEGDVPTDRSGARSDPDDRRGRDDR